MIKMQSVDFRRGHTTRCGGNSANVAEYSFQITYHDNVFIAFASVGLHHPNICQRKNEKKIKREGLEWNQRNVWFKSRQPSGNIIDRETNFPGSTLGRGRVACASGK